jgi:hypothetical protein
MDSSLAVLFVLLALVTLFHYFQNKAQDAICIVQADTFYQNNHHVEGVGYYHAGGHRWFEHPWNEFREGLGYYWYGTWHTEPAPQGCVSSKPEPKEASRVNSMWCAQNPERQKRYVKAVRLFGFGLAEGRREGR